MKLEEFKEIVSEELDRLPQYCFNDLTGGVVVNENSYLHPKRVSDDLYILGTYSSSAIRKQVTLYFGSFEKTIRDMDSNRDFVRKKIREVIRHEFRHHLEGLAGMHGKDSLEQEDRDRMSEYYTAHGYR